MSASITSGTYPRAAARPGAVVSGWAQRFVKAVSDMGERRAAHHLGLLALQYEHSNPELAGQLRSTAREFAARQA